jgi:hypothetical protein
MAATAEQQQLTEVLLQKVEETDFPSAPQLDRLEQLISTREELVDYMAILTQKVEGTTFPPGPMLDRLDRLMRVLRRLDSETA